MSRSTLGRIEQKSSVHSLFFAKSQPNKQPPTTRQAVVATRLTSVLDVGRQRGLQIREVYSFYSKAHLDSELELEIIRVFFVRETWTLTKTLSYVRLLVFIYRSKKPELAPSSSRFDPWPSITWADN